MEELAMEKEKEKARLQSHRTTEIEATSDWLAIDGNLQRLTERNGHRFQPTTAALAARVPSNPPGILTQVLQDLGSLGSDEKASQRAAKHWVLGARAVQTSTPLYRQVRLLSLVQRVDVLR